jgi:hypothetical protein
MENDRKRVRVARGIYRQSNGHYTACVMVEGRPRFRTLCAATLVEAQRERELLRLAARAGSLPVSPRLTFAEVAARWLADFEVKVSAGARGERTLDLYRSQLRLYLLPRFGRHRLGLITPDDIVGLLRRAAGAAAVSLDVQANLGRA